MRLGIVTTLRDAGDTIDSFIAWHLGIGFDRLFLFFDDPQDPVLARLATHPQVTAIAHDDALRERWRALPEYAQFGGFTDKEVMARQVLNVGVAMALARDQGLDWLLHIDADELFFSPSHPLPELFALSAGLDTVLYPNFEAVPEQDEIRDAFRDVDLFKIAPSLNPGPTTAAGFDLLRATPQLPADFHFHFYSNGKSAVRLGADKARPLGVHTFSGASAGQAPQAYVLHYACCGFDAFWKKYERLGRFSDRWFGRDDIRAGIGALHLDARDVVATGDRAAALEFYRRRIAIVDPARAQALIDHGILMRITDARRMLASL